MDLDKRLQRLQGNFQPGLDGKPFGYGTFLQPITEGSKIPSKRSREHHSHSTNQHTANQQMRNNQPMQASVTSDPANDDDVLQIPSNSTETTSPSKIIQVMTIPLDPLLSPFISVPNSSELQVQQPSASVMVEDNAPTISNLLSDVSNVPEITNTDNSQDQILEDDKISKQKGNTENMEVQQPAPSKQEENTETEKQQISTTEKDKKETETTSKSQTPESAKEKNREKVSIQETSNEKAKDRKSKSIDKQRTDEKKSKDKEESREKKQDKKSKDSRSKDTKTKKSQEKELDKKKDKRDQTRTRSSSRSPSRSRSRERDRGRNYDRDRDYKEKRRRRSYSYSSDDGNASSPSRSRYSSSDDERDSRKRRRKGKSRSRSRSRSRDRKDRDRKDRDRSKNKKRKRSKSRDRGLGKSTEDSKKSKPIESASSDITNLSTSNMKDASLIAEDCKKNATKLKHVADKLSDKSQAGEIYFQSGLQFLACAHAYEEGNMHDKAVMMYQQTGTFFESIAKMYSHDEKFKVLVSMCCKCVAVALTRRFILDPSRLRQLHTDLSTTTNSNTANSTTNTGTPNRSPSSNSTTQNTLDPSPPQVVSTSPSLPSASSNIERSSSSNASQNHSSQPTVRLKGEKQQNLYDMIKCFEMWNRAEKNLAIQHFSMTNVKELIQALTQYAKTNLTPASTNQED